jgi:DNA-damage-inducible protein D
MTRHSYFEWSAGDEENHCENVGNIVADHFRDVTKMVEIGSQTTREIDDVLLTRYACYLIAQNGDPRKDEIAFAQTYFALQTRKQELLKKISKN